MVLVFLVADNVGWLGSWAAVGGCVLSVYALTTIYLNDITIASYDRPSSVGSLILGHILSPANVATHVSRRMGVVID